MANSHRPSIGATRARQGRRGLPILWVLVIGMALVILGFLITWAFHARGLSSVSQPYATQPSQANGFQAPPPNAASRQNYQKGAPLAPRNGGNPTNPPS
ncbi:MAG TPA: hypothetical protein VLI41_00115 [Phenylobacterium sp.]|uniref:hypothetical protein n=1 Tax=Phenylobacterium sp. TaxID=1871053 RepID=UPI002CA6A034|nr:hypothetical protein [Phenylobacterium sp.]HSV01580.1 hypothetical protein [Phenylobacterium sp.]